MRKLTLALAALLIALARPAFAGYWQLVDTQSLGVQPPANEVWINRVSASGTGAVLETQISAHSSHEDRGKALISQANWSIPPSALTPGQKHFWQVELGATRAELGAHWHLTHSVSLFECRTQPGKPGSSCGGQRPIASTNIWTAGSRVLTNRGNGEWIVPSGTDHAALWLVVDTEPALYRLVYSYRWSQGSAPSTATGGGSVQAGGAAGGGRAYTSIPPQQPERPSGPLAGSTPGSSTVVGGAPASGDEVEIFNNGNLSGVENGGKAPLVTLSRAARITSILTYHWNHGQGSPAGGTVQILDENGQVYGPWRVEVKNKVYWIARPNTLLPAGRYRVLDSEPATWAHNSGSSGLGHTIIKGLWAGAGGGVVHPAAPTVAAPPALRPPPASPPLASPGQGNWPSIAGDWRCDEGTCQIQQTGDRLTFIKGSIRSGGRFLNANRVAATDWDNLQGRLGAYYRGNRMAASEAKEHFGLEVSEILWLNGSVWSRPGSAQ